MPNYHGLTRTWSFLTLQRASSRADQRHWRHAWRATVFRIDHDESFNETTTCNTSHGKKVRGSASTGGMTAGWSRGQCRALRQLREWAGRTGSVWMFPT